MGSSLQSRFQPGLVFALAKIALIGIWNGRTFLDDDRDLSDVADFAPVEALPIAALDTPAEPAQQAPHSAAA